MNSKLVSLQILSGLVATALLAGCGVQTDPTSDYKDLGATEPAHAVKDTSQGVQAADIFYADFPANTNFIEGEPNSFDIVINSKLKDITFGLAATNLPAGLQLVRKDANHYSVTGTIAVGSTNGLQQGVVSPFTITAVNAAGDQTELHMFQNILHVWHPTITAYPTRKQPLVESQTISGLSVQEGESLPISIVVQDAGVYGSNVPQMQYSPRGASAQNGEVSFVSALPGLMFDAQPTSLGGGKFKYSGTLDTKKLTLPEGKKNVTVRFVVNFRSPSGLTSADEIVDVKVVRSEPAPAPAAPVAAADGSTSATPTPVAVKKPVKKKVTKKKKQAVVTTAEAK